MYETPAPAKRKPRVGFILLVALAVMLSVCVVGTVVAMVRGAGQPTAARVHPTVQTSVRATVTPDPGSRPVADPVKPSPTRKARPAPVQIIDEDTPGLVGDDFPAGTYRTTESVAGRQCYWLKSSDAEGSSIIDNNLPQGGRPQVTLRKGQWFTSQDCGTWAKLR